MHVQEHIKKIFFFPLSFISFFFFFAKTRSLYFPFAILAFVLYKEITLQNTRGSRTIISYINVTFIRPFPFLFSLDSFFSLPRIYNVVVYDVPSGVIFSFSRSRTSKKLPLRPATFSSCSLTRYNRFRGTPGIFRTQSRNTTCLLPDDRPQKPRVRFQGRFSASSKSSSHLFSWHAH